MISIQTLLERLGITAKLAGTKWQALCPHPDHTDRTPSWFIRDEPGTDRHGYHKCMSCGFSGGASGLVQTVLQCSPSDARTFLGGEDVVRPIPRAVDIKMTGGMRLFGGFVLPPEVVIAPLAEWPTGARKYATEKRRLPAWQVDRWGLGYAIHGRLEGRIVIPYRDLLGMAQGYTARAYAGSGKRYLEPSDDEHADRSVMFGMAHWLDEDVDPEVVWVTEGAFNALAVERVLRASGADYPCIAAAAGSETRLGPALSLGERFPAVVVLADPDHAGDKFMAKMHAALGRHTRVVPLRLPTGMDADSMDPDELEKRLTGIRLEL